MGSLQVEETSAYCTVNHRASESNYQLSNMKRPARDSNRWPQRLEARTLTTTPPSPLGLYQRSVKSLTPLEAGILRTLLLEYQDTFSKESHDLGCLSEIKHTINTGDEHPVKEAMH